MERTATRILLAYPPVVLVIGSLFSDAIAATLSVVLVVLYVVSLLAGWWAVFLAASIAAVLAAPVLVASNLGYWAVLLGLPSLVAVARGLSGVAGGLVLVTPPRRRAPSTMAISIGLTLITLSLLAGVMSSPVLGLTILLLLLALLGATSVQYIRLGPRPLAVTAETLTVRAGETVRLDCEIRPNRPVAMLVRLCARSGISMLEGGPFALEGAIVPALALTPLLGGPSDVYVNASVTDRFGLVNVGQGLTVGHLNVVPRAKVARWVAEEFLARRGVDYSMGDSLSKEVAGFLSARGGAEYASSRMYVPGDTLLAIDWKRTARLQSLVVKTFDDGTRSPGVLVVNLSASGADEADRLVYEFLSAVLTISSMSYGASLAMCGHGGPGEPGRVLFDTELVRAALKFCEDVRVVPTWRRELRPVGLQELRGRLTRVSSAGGEAAPKLASLLGLKEHALELAVEGDECNVLMRNAALRHRPAWCIAITAMHADAEAMLTGLRRMERSGIRTKLVNVGTEPSRIDARAS